MLNEELLIGMLLNHPKMIRTVRERGQAPDKLLEHTGLRRILKELYAIDATGLPDDIEATLGVLLIDRPDLMGKAVELKIRARDIREIPTSIFEQDQDEDPSEKLLRMLQEQYKERRRSNRNKELGQQQD